MKNLSQEIEGFDPKANIEHYKQLVKNVFALLGNEDFKVEPIGEGTDNNSEVDEKKVLNEIKEQMNGNFSPEMEQMFKMFAQMSQQNGKVPELV